MCYLQHYTSQHTYGTKKQKEKILEFIKCLVRRYDGLTGAAYFLTLAALCYNEVLMTEDMEKPVWPLYRIYFLMQEFIFYIFVSGKPLKQKMRWNGYSYYLYLLYFPQ